jgi:hypothetical protein
MLRSLLINILLILLCSICAFSQKADSVRADSVKKHSYIPTGIRVGGDLISPVKSQVQSNFTGWEVNADVDFYRYYLALDYGSWGRTFSSDSGYYSNDGTYWRMGIDVNFLLKDPDRNMFFIGARYGKANFSEDLTVVAYNHFLNPPSLVTNGYTHSGINGSWFELTTGIRVKIYKIVWMGYTARLKFGLKYDNTENIIPSDVPGYGQTEKDSYWGFNYQIFIRIPLRKQPALLPEKKKN